MASDSPTFSIRNAQGHDGKGTSNTFRVAVAKTDQELATVMVPAGSGTTTTRFERPTMSGEAQVLQNDVDLGSCTSTGQRWSLRAR